MTQTSKPRLKRITLNLILVQAECGLTIHKPKASELVEILKGIKRTVTEALNERTLRLPREHVSSERLSQ
jgi:hypothetical protein